jgi:hypothetical protein
MNTRFIQEGIMVNVDHKVSRTSYVHRRLRRSPKIEVQKLILEGNLGFRSRQAKQAGSICDATS